MGKRLLFVVTEDWYFVSHRLPLALAARDAGYEVAVATRRGNEAQVIEAAGIHLLPFEMDRGSTNPLKELSTVLRLAQLLRRESPDLLHLVALKPVLLGNVAGRLAGVKRRVSAVAGMGFLFTKGGRGGLVMPLVRYLLGHSLRGGLVVVQNADDAALIEQLGVPAASLRLIRGCGVDLVRFRVEPEPGGRPVVMLPSRMLWDKGVAEFVGAVRRLKGQGVDARFVLVGAPDPANPAAVAEGQLDEWQAEGLVEWWGHQERMETVLPRAHVVCLPSYREGMPKVVLEAMACGRAVVTCDVPGCREAVVKGESGLLVPPQDDEALAHAIGQLLGDASLRRQLGAAARERAERFFSIERVAQETLRLYRDLLVERSA